MESESEHQDELREQEAPAKPEMPELTDEYSGSYHRKSEPEDAEGWEATKIANPDEHYGRTVACRKEPTEKEKEVGKTGQYWEGTDKEFLETFDV